MNRFLRFITLTVQWLAVVVATMTGGWLLMKVTGDWAELMPDFWVQVVGWLILLGWVGVVWFFWWGGLWAYRKGKSVQDELTQRRAQRKREEKRQEDEQKEKDDKRKNDERIAEEIWDSCRDQLVNARKEWQASDTPRSELDDVMVRVAGIMRRIDPELNRWGIRVGSEPDALRRIREWIGRVGEIFEQENPSVEGLNAIRHFGRDR